MQPSRSPLTTALLAIIAVVFVFEILTDAPRDVEVLLSLGAIHPQIFARGDWWRLVAAMFLHAGMLHWLANSWALYQLGSLYEAMFGSWRFILTYFGTGLIASTASTLFTRGYSVGASGAIFGILGAFIFSILRSPVWRHQPWTRSLLGQLVFWAAINIALGFSVPNIDNVAHIAGLVSGLLFGLIPHRVPPPPPASSVIDVIPYEESDADPEERRGVR